MLITAFDDISKQDAESLLKAILYASAKPNNAINFIIIIHLKGEEQVGEDPLLWRTLQALENVVVYSNVDIKTILAHNSIKFRIMTGDPNELF